MLVSMCPKATAAVHVPTLDIKQLFLGLAITLSPLCDLTTWPAHARTLTFSAADVEAFKQNCPAKILAQMQPNELPLYAWGNIMLNMEWAPAMASLFGTHPGLEAMITAVLQEKDLHKVPSATALLESPVLAPYAAHARTQAAARAPQRLEQTYHVSRKFIKLVSAVQR
jgi:hypothetical protein